MYRKQVRRRRAVLVALIVVSLVLLSSHFSEAESGPLHTIQRGVSAALSPIGEGAERVLKPARDLVNWFDETFDARGENEQLRKEVAERIGLPVVVSSAVETSVGLAAGVALAAALPALPYACGLATTSLLDGDVVTEPLLPVDGALPVRSVEVDEERLARHRMAPQDEASWFGRLAVTRALDPGRDGVRRG